MTPSITEEYRLSDAHIAPNRLQLAPMTTCLSNDDGTVSEAEIEWYRSRGAAGFGTVVTGGFSVHPAGQIRLNQARVDSDDYLPGLQDLSQGRAPGTLLLGQLLHGGLRVNHAWSGHTHQPVGPSEGSGVRALTDTDIEALLEDYVAAALRLHAAGFDGIDLHAAHGYLPAQFLSATENQRSDRWGGSFKNRARFTLELVRRTRAALPPESIVQLRISAEDIRQSRGIDLDETAELAVMATEAGATTISLSVWDVGLPAQKHPHTTPVSHVRARLGTAPHLVAAGKLWDAVDARRAFEQGADLLAVGRSAIFHRDAPRYFQVEGVTPQRPPFSRNELYAQGVGEPFVAYLADKWDTFVAPSNTIP